MRFWLAVVQREHVQRGVAMGIAQAGHGTRSGIGRMSPGDGLVYYSPKTAYPEGDPLKEFTAIGIVAPGEPWQGELSAGDSAMHRDGEDTRPWRRKVDYDEGATAAPIAPLLETLELTRGNRNWGYVMRRGFLELSQHDFDVIAREMAADSLER